MYCEILQHRHTERKLESVVIRETHRHTSLFYNYLVIRDKRMQSQMFCIFRIAFVYPKEYRIYLKYYT